MSENNRASVYVHINLVNGKKYFGITTKDPEVRWKNGNGYHNNAHFMSAVKKYGWSNFGHFVLYRNIPIKIAKSIEEMLIREYMSYNPMFGYNKTMGGELEKHTEETRRKISENNSNPPKPVIRFDKNTGEITGLYAGVREAESITGVDHSNISKVCNFEHEAAGGSCWCYVSEVME